MYLISWGSQTGFGGRYGSERRGRRVLRKLSRVMASVPLKDEMRVVIVESTLARRLSGGGDKVVPLINAWRRMSSARDWDGAISVSGLRSLIVRKTWAPGGWDTRVRRVSRTRRVMSFELQPC